MVLISGNWGLVKMPIVFKIDSRIYEKEVEWPWFDREAWYGELEKLWNRGKKLYPVGWQESTNGSRNGGG